MRPTILSAAVILLLCPALAFAQETLPDLETGNRVRVELADGETREGRVVATDGATLSLDWDPEQRFGLSDVDRLWIRRDDSRLGALIGAGIVGGGSFAFFAWICESLDDDGCNEWGLVLGLSSVGAVAGALVGGAIGHGSVRWDLLYSRQDARASLGLDPRGLALHFSF